MHSYEAPKTKQGKFKALHADADKAVHKPQRQAARSVDGPQEATPRSYKAGTVDSNRGRVRAEKFSYAPSRVGKAPAKSRDSRAKARFKR